ncbi:DUF5995 domain-containing protein [Sulfidibacter corallicola]|uniref:Uncharacterized protein n=1 Tax=Sulfidibacter corallicola TaxID=2818388 RepID=A0A8A4U235_SULCO|nr:DUF5995 family protein [Sulfidibacter corallicola]QTD52795.1 hypothetical protein J3U87_09990 [Sulfidibacter corallicola]
MRARNVAEVLEQLEKIVLHTKETASPLGYFAATYRQVTLKIQEGIVSGSFEDGPRMDRFAAAVTGRFLEAYASWRQREPMARSWRVAFAAAGDDAPKSTILQHLLLGMNAHINLDLGVTVADVFSGAAVEAFQGDFGALNDILEGTVGALQSVLGKASPLLDVLDRVGGRSDEVMIDFSMREARAMAWHVAQLLDALSPNHRDSVVRMQDKLVAQIGARIARPGGLIGKTAEVIALSESFPIAEVIDAIDTFSS